MNNKTITSVAVALDGSPNSRASLEAAADLASRFGTELVGIFIEDINLLRMAELPCSEELLCYSDSPLVIDSARMERLLRMQAREVREMFEKSAARSGVRHSFRIIRGMVPEEVIAAAREAGILVLGRKGRSPSCRNKLGSTAQAALSLGTRTVLFMQHGFNTAKGTMLVLYDSSEGSKEALETALLISGGENPLHIIITDPVQETALICEQEASERVVRKGMSAEYHHIPETRRGVLAQCIRMIESGLLIMSDDIHLYRETLLDFICSVDCPVMVIRHP